MTGWKAWLLGVACALQMALPVGEVQALAETMPTRHLQKAMPETKAALKHQIKAFEQGQPAYDDMSEELAFVTRPQIPRINRRFAQLGPLRSLSFRGVGISGWDVYEARFANGMAICRIRLASDGKVSGLLFQWGP
jgi:hypothetical protein